MISPQQVDRLRIFEFIGKENSDDLNAEGATVHIIPKKEKLLIWWVSILFKDIKKVVKLSDLLVKYPWISPTIVIGDTSLRRFG